MWGRRDVGDAGVQHFHERGQRHRQRDDPGIDPRPPNLTGPRPHGMGCCRSQRTFTSGSTDMPGPSNTPFISEDGSKSIFTGTRCTTLT